MSAYNSGVLTISDSSSSYWPEARVVFRGGAIRTPRSTNRFVLIGFQGCGVIEGKFIARGSDLYPSIARWADLENVLDAVRASTGSYTLQLWDSVSGNYILLNDPLGGGHIFRYESAEVSAFGFEPEQIARTLRADYGIKISRDLRYFAGAALTETAVYGAPSPYLGLSPLDAGTGIEVAPDGSVNEIIYFQSRRPFAEATYEAAVDRVCDEIVANCAAVAAYDAEFHVIHLTGGFDSRLVLSGLRMAGVAERFWYNNFTPGNEDDRIAQALCATLGLKFTRWWGYTGPTDANRLPWGLGASILSGGVVPAGLPAGMSPTSAVVLQGGYGECFRTFNALDLRAVDRDARVIAHQLWRWAAFPAEEERRNSVFASSFLSEVTSLLESRLYSIVESGVAYEHALAELYLKYRNRCFIGQQAWYGSAISHRFDPLYTVSGSRLGEDLSFEERRANFLGMDIMRRLDPSLLAYPFDRPMVSDWYIRRRGVVEPREFSRLTAEIEAGPDPIDRRAQSTASITAHPAIAFSESVADEQLSRVRELSEVIAPVYNVDRLLETGPDASPETKRLWVLAVKSLALAELL